MHTSAGNFKNKNPAVIVLHRNRFPRPEDCESGKLGDHTVKSLYSVVSDLIELLENTADDRRLNTCLFLVPPRD